MIVQVTQKDIEEALKAKEIEGFSEEYQCPIAQSLRRRFPLTNVSVGGREAHVGFSSFTLPFLARDFIGDFDNGRLVFPIRFKMKQ